MWYAHLHLIKVVYLRDNMWLPIGQEVWFRPRVCLSLEAQGTEREDAMTSCRKGFKSKACLLILSALLKENVCTCFLLSSWFSFWHWIKACLSSCSSWFSREFSRHFWVCWSDNTSSSLCIDWISFLQWHSRSTANVAESVTSLYWCMMGGATGERLFNPELYRWLHEPKNWLIFVTLN